MDILYRKGNNFCDLQLPFLDKVLKNENDVVLPQNVYSNAHIYVFRPATPEETTFHLLHLSLFREYLDFEFSALKVIMVNKQV